MSILGALTGCVFVVEAYNLQLLVLNLLDIISGLLAAVSFAVYSISSDYGMRKYPKPKKHNILTAGRIGSTGGR
jgi:drug/metabolite transporter (DMT)-like permease